MNQRMRSMSFLPVWVLTGALALLSAGMGNAFGADPDPRITHSKSSSAETLYREGLDYHHKGEHAIAAEKFSQAITKGKKTADVYSYLGEALVNLKRYEESLSSLSEAIRLEPKDLHAYAFRGFAITQQGRHEEAIRDFSAALAIRPNRLTATLLEARGNTYWAMNQLDKAAKDFEKIIAQDPRNSRGYFLRGKLHGAQEKFREAIADMSSALDRDPTRKLPYFFRGFAFGCLKEYDKALHDYTALIQAVPEAAIGYAYRGGIYSRLENDRLAEADLRYAIEHGYSQPFVYLLLAYSLAAQGQLDQALKVNNEIVSLGPAPAADFGEAYFQRGRFLLIKKQYDQAQSFYEKGIGVAEKLGLKTMLSRILGDLQKLLEYDAEMRQGGVGILRLLEDSVAQVQLHSLYDKPFACDLEFPAPMADEKGDLSNF